MTFGRKAPRWTRIVLGAMGALVLATTIPAYFDPHINPALATLTGDAAGLGSVAGAFLGRQLTLALLALIATILGGGAFMFMGALGILIFNLHDAIMVTLFGGNPIGAAFGLLFAALAGVIIWKLREE